MMLAQSEVFSSILSGAQEHERLGWKLKFGLFLNELSL